MNPPESDFVSERLIRTVCKRLSEGKRVRRNLPVWGRLAIDRPLPFLCVYRRPSRKADRATYRLVTSEASYLTCTARTEARRGYRPACWSGDRDPEGEIRGVSDLGDLGRGPSQ